jgi:hypothetical protein
VAAIVVGFAQALMNSWLTVRLIVQTASQETLSFLQELRKVGQ